MISLRNPPYRAYTVEPYTTDELDNLENAERIWATILEIQKYYEERLEDQYELFLEDLERNRWSVSSKRSASGH